MGMSILDRYAAAFTAHFYEQIARKQQLSAAFKDSIEFLRQNEYQDQIEAGSQAPLPLQWIIPNLYLAEKIEHLVNWQAKHNPLELSSYRFIVEQNRLLLKHAENYVFVGRRKEKAEIQDWDNPL